MFSYCRYFQSTYVVKLHNNQNLLNFEQIIMLNGSQIFISNFLEKLMFLNRTRRSFSNTDLVNVVYGFQDRPMSYETINLEINYEFSNALQCLRNSRNNEMMQISIRYFPDRFSPYFPSGPFGHKNKKENSLKVFGRIKKTLFTVVGKTQVSDETTENDFC